MSRRLIFPCKGEVSFEKFEPPRIAAGEIMVQTLYSLMSIGTETTILNQRYDPDTHYARMFSFPQLKTGVQSLGRVVENGGDTSEFSIDDIVYMRMGHGSHQVLPEANCTVVPSAIDLKDACWCGLAKTAFRAAWAGQFAQGLELLIVGAGPVGQMVIRWASAAEAKTIAVADPSELRLQHALTGGATAVFAKTIDACLEEIGSINDGNGPALIVDATGNPEVLPHALAASAKFGTVVLLGDTGFPGKQCLTSDVMTKGLTILATHDHHDRDGWTQRRVDELFFRLVQNGTFNLDGLITAEFSPADYKDAYELANERRGEAMGILFDWTRDTW